MNNDRQNAIQKSRVLLDCLQVLNPKWQQKDLAAVLKVSAAMITYVRNDDPARQKPFSGSVQELARYKIAEALGALTGNRHGLPDLLSIADSLIDCCRDHGVEETEKLLLNIEELYAKGGLVL